MRGFNLSTKPSKAGVPNLWDLSLMTWGGADVITIEIKYTINVALLNHPDTSHPHHHHPALWMKLVPGTKTSGDRSQRSPIVQIHTVRMLQSEGFEPRTPNSRVLFLYSHANLPPAWMGGITFSKCWEEEKGGIPWLLKYLWRKHY